MNTLDLLCWLEGICLMVSLAINFAVGLHLLARDDEPWWLHMGKNGGR